MTPGAMNLINLFRNIRPFVRPYRWLVVITLVLAFVFLHEEFTMKSLIGCILIGAGTLVMVL